MTFQRLTHQPLSRTWVDIVATPVVGGCDSRNKRSSTVAVQRFYYCSSQKKGEITQQLRFLPHWGKKGEGSLGPVRSGPVRSGPVRRWGRRGSLSRLLPPRMSGEASYLSCFSACSSGAVHLLNWQRPGCHKILLAGASWANWSCVNIIKLNFYQT